MAPTCENLVCLVLHCWRVSERQDGCAVLPAPVTLNLTVKWESGRGWTKGGVSCLADTVRDECVSMQVVPKCVREWRERTCRDFSWGEERRRVVDLRRKNYLLSVCCNVKWKEITRTCKLTTQGWECSCREPTRLWVREILAPDMPQQQAGQLPGDKPANHHNKKKKIIQKTGF